MLVHGGSSRLVPIGAAEEVDEVDVQGLSSLAGLPVPRNFRSAPGLRRTGAPGRRGVRSMPGVPGTCGPSERRTGRRADGRAAPSEGTRRIAGATLQARARGLPEPRIKHLACQPAGVAANRTCAASYRRRLTAAGARVVNGSGLEGNRGSTHACESRPPDNPARPGLCHRPPFPVANLTAVRKFASGYQLHRSPPRSTMGARRVSRIHADGAGVQFWRRSERSR